MRHIYSFNFDKNTIAINHGSGVRPKCENHNVDLFFQGNHNFSKNNFWVKSKVFVVVFLLLLFVPVANAATKTASTGNWNAAGTWLPSGVPASGDDVVIPNGVTLTGDITTTCASITFNGASAFLTINSGITVTVTGAVTLNSASGSTTYSLISGAGSLSCGSVVVGTTVTPSTPQSTIMESTIANLVINGNLSLISSKNSYKNNNPTFAHTSNIVSIGGAITTAGPPGTTISYFMDLLGPTLNLSGINPFNLSVSAGNSIILNSAGAIVNYNGTLAQTALGTDYDILKVNNGAGVTLGEAATTTSLTIGDITSNSIFNDGGYQLTATGTLNLTSGTFKLGTAAAATIFPAFATLNYGAGTTVAYISGVSQTVAAINYPSLTLSGAGQKNAATGTIVVSSTLTNSSVFDMADNTLTLGTSTVNTGGIFRFSGASNGVAISTGTVEYYGTTQTVASGTYSTLNLTAIGTKTAGGAITVTTLNNGGAGHVAAILDMAGNNLTGTISNTGATIRFSGASNGRAVSTGTVEYYGTGQTVATGSYSNLTISGSATVGGTVNVSGTLTTTPGSTLTIGSTGGLFAGNLTATNAGTLTIDPLGKATIPNLVNSGTLNLNSSASGIFSLIVSNYSGSGTANIQIYLTGGVSSTGYSWHYISSPINSLSTSTFTANTKNLAQFVESLPVSDIPYSNQRGWIAFNNYSYYTKLTTGTPDYGFSTLSVGKGYNYYAVSPYNYQFSGTLNTSAISPALSYSGLDDTKSGYNLLGNPFTCGLNWDVITAGTFPDFTSTMVSFTHDNQTYTYQSGVGVPDGTTGLIPPMQGFVVKTLDGFTSGNLLISTFARTHTTTSRYKGETAAIPLVRLSTAENGKSYETVVRFDNNAKSGLDYNYDAQRLFSSSDLTAIYSTAGNLDLTINGLPFPAPSIEIPIAVNLLTDGSHTITAMQVQDLDGYNVTMTDKLNNISMDLKSSKDFTFTSSAGLIKDRFVLNVSTITTGIENPKATDKSFNVYTGFDKINIQTLSDQWDGKTGSLKVMDLSGRTIINQENAQFSKNSLIRLTSPSTNGLYIIEIRSGVQRFVGKVVIR